MHKKVIAGADAAALIQDGDVLTTSGFVGIGVPDALLSAVETRFLETGHPRNLSLVFAAGQGDGGERGLNRLGHEGLLRRVVGGHWGLIPKVAALAVEGKIEGWNLPQGCISQLFRDAAAGKPGMLTKVGLDTFVDPRNGGGAVNDISVEPQVELMTRGDEEYLFYPAPKLTVALLRGTTADEAGNVTMEREALIIDNLAQAMAVKNAGGIVIVQVERLARGRSLPAREVQIPGIFVDAVVVAPPELHMQTYRTAFSHAFTNRIRPPAGEIPHMPLDARKVIARRCAFELPVNGVINLGIGMPEGVAAVSAEEGLLDHVTLTAEPGVVGGQPASGLDFGAAVDVDAVVPQSAQFDFYDGGGLAGAGGFINISQNAKSLVFAGTFTAKGIDVDIRDGALTIRKEGTSRKFLEAVEQVTFSGRRAARLGQPVLYVTERCVFQLRPDGLHLIEVAPGVEIERDIVGQMAFRPIIEEVRIMDARIFQPEPMDLKRELLHLDLPDRIALDAGTGRLFINFEKMRIRSLDEIEQVRRQVIEVCGLLRDKVDVVVNYDGFQLEDDITKDYADMVADLESRFYKTVTRYSGSAFMRLKLGETLPKASPHIFETREAAQAFLDRPT
ncbi:acyl CoA:acetate/3-ketoacid CoA transferase [Jannaschia seohaensis]|uniref:Propionate CoA-transferase n=1 Tax=Jannaschia seohaensis TaxID=475081 RepID=A0A2Y9B5R6_9RHOB|nr:CoA-transferase [Jannaschia seohaensis]PWJ10208.1 propionate CoA-transferase [Jannaschia seohaensis]SSA51781.1 propionate CoA-transferase [Jannaschia seohaensis]